MCAFTAHARAPRKRAHAHTNAWARCRASSSGLLLQAIPNALEVHFDAEVFYYVLLPPIIFEVYRGPTRPLLPPCGQRLRRLCAQADH